MFKNKKVIIFDMDGTLIDSIGIWNQVDIELIQTLGGPELLESEVQKVRDEKLREYRADDNPYASYCDYLKNLYAKDKTIKDVLKLRSNISTQLLRKKITYKKDADRYLHLLKMKGYILVIASTTRRVNMDIYIYENENMIQLAPIKELFDLVLTREDVSMIKPDPEVYLKVLDLLQVSKEECLIFEDSLVGVESAKNAGIDCISIDDYYSSNDLEKIKSLSLYHALSFSELIEKEIY